MSKLRYNFKKPRIGDAKLTPRGKNGLSAYASFYQKSVYQDTSYPVGEGMGPSPIDFIGDYNLLYGRIDPDGAPIYLAEDNLMQLHSDDGKTHFVLNFVADAYEDMREYVLFAARTNKIDNKNSVYADVPPARAWDSIHKRYHKYWEDLFLAFDGTYMNSERNAKIHDFDSFMKIFMQFAQHIGAIFPMTRTEYITSKYVSPSISGLIVEMVEGVHDDDYAKYVGFIRDNNFSWMRKVANRFGFKIDKNAPWRFVADINSPPMKEYMAKYGVKNTQGFFQTYYFPAYMMEIRTLKKYLWMCYDRFVVQSPGVATVRECPTSAKLVTVYKNRGRISEEEFDKRYLDRYWLRVFIYLRAIETHQRWDQRKLEQVVKKALEYEKYVDIRTACEYIDRTFRDNSREIFITRKNLTEEETFAIIQENRYQKPNFSF